MRHFNIFRVGASALFISALCASAAPADTELFSDSVRTLDDVTVTAIKQKADLSLQPLSSTVVTGAQTRAWHVNSVKNISEIAPNFYIPDYGSRMTSSIYVRGIGARMEQPAVGLTVDNVPFLNKDNYDFDLSDIERVEVLRGPQTTLYGRNTMGGQINIYTLSPMQYQGSRITAMLGNGPTARLALSHYVKFSPRLAMSFSGDFHYSHGFYDNHYNAKPVEQEKAASLRWRTQWRASSTVSLENVAAFSLARDGGYAYEYFGSGQINYNDTCFYRRNSFSDGLTLKWNAGNVSVSSITGFQYLDDNMTLDQDFTPMDYFTLTQKRKEWSVSEEIVARGSVSDYSWLFGVFAFYRHTRMEAPVTLKEDGIKRMITDRINNNDRIPVRLDFKDREILLGSDFRIPLWNIAVYHQSDYRLGRWLFSAGMRLDFEKTFMDYRSTGDAAYSVSMKRVIPGMPPVNIDGNVAIDEPGRLRQHFWEFMPKVTVSYDLPMESGSSVYAAVGEGYKSGGFNTQMFSEVLQQRMQSKMMEQMPANPGMPSLAGALDVDNVVSYKPEHSWNYEVGAHIGCAQGRVMTDMSLFYIDCRDQQITTFPDASTTGRITTNAGRTRSFGAEVQIRYMPTRQWAFNASYGYTNATFRRYVDRGVDYRGNYVPYAPSNTLFLSGTFNHGAGKRWEMVYGLNMRGVGRIYWNEANTESQNFYAQLGASVTAKCNWLSVEAWMENVTGTKFHTFYFESIGNRFVQRGKPRRFGFTVRMNFDAAR